jgi:hypothetical protein
VFLRAEVEGKKAGERRRLVKVAWPHAEDGVCEPQVLGKRDRRVLLQAHRYGYPLESQGHGQHHDEFEASAQASP